jgi:twitching motility protein PilT
MIGLQHLLKAMLEKGASDLHITANSPPLLRINGELVRVKMDPFTPADTKTICYSVLSDKQKQVLEEEKELDFSFGLKGLSRYRVNLFHQQGCIAGAFRRIPFMVYTFEQLGLPEVVKSFVTKTAGLVLVTGPTGSGKSTTLAAMIDTMNENLAKHIITVEDPIEFLHQHKKSIINQRELGHDTLTYGAALRSALRQDPDIVLIGEMRDLETIEAALTIAETGHLVFSTLHTNSSIQTINRIVDVFAADHQDQIRTKLSFVLQGIISQQLIPRGDGKGRVLALEVLVPTLAIRSLIRESKIHQVYSQMQLGKGEHGMITLNQSLENLVRGGFLTPERALQSTYEVAELAKMLQRGI